MHHSSTNISKKTRQKETDLQFNICRENATHKNHLPKSSARSSILAFNHSTYHVNIIIMSFNSALVIIWYFPVSGCMYLLHCIYYVRNIHKTKRNTRLYQGVPRLIYLNISLLYSEVHLLTHS